MIDDLDLPPPAMRDWIGSRSNADFLAWGGYFWRKLRIAFGLRPESRVLEVGCGPGSLARWIAPDLRSPGSYVGFDINPEAIAVCATTISARFPLARFEFANLRNVYARDNTGSAAEYRFPAEDGSIDVVAGISLWTHLLANDARAYLREVARVLAPEGKALITLLLGPDTVLPPSSIPGPDGLVLPRLPSGEYAHSEWLVAYPFETFSDLALDAGLEAEIEERGDWRRVVADGENPDSWTQDIIRIRRAS